MSGIKFGDAQIHVGGKIIDIYCFEIVKWNEHTIASFWADIKPHGICPVCYGGMMNLVAHLNDTHRWSFLQIATFLENNPQYNRILEHGTQTNS